MRREIKVGMDVDGVLASFHTLFCKKHGFNPAAWTTWEVPPEFGEGARLDFQRFMADPGTWVSLSVKDGAKEAVHRIAAARIPVVFVSSVHESFYDLRLWWLRRHFGKYLGRDIKLILARSAEKPAVAKREGVTHFLEDRLSTAVALAEAGITSYLVPSTYMGDPPPNVSVVSVRTFAHAVVGQAHDARTAAFSERYAPRLRVMLCGRRGRGKDALCRAIQESFSEVERAAFADALKDASGDILNFAIDSLGLPRESLTPEYVRSDACKPLLGPFFQWLGTDFVRSVDSEFWVKRFHELHGAKPHLVVTDARFPNEVEYGRQHGFVIVRVTGPNRRADGHDGRNDDHPSEASVDALEVDVECENTGTLDDLRMWVHTRLLPEAAPRVMARRAMAAEAQRAT